MVCLSLWFYLNFKINMTGWLLNNGIYTNKGIDFPYDTNPILLSILDMPLFDILNKFQKGSSHSQGYKKETTFKVLVTLRKAKDNEVI